LSGNGERTPTAGDHGHPAFARTSMSAAQTIRRIGFRKWYERELMRSHANLVLLLFATLGMLGAIEVYSVRLGWLDQGKVIAAGVASAVIGYAALRRYLYLLNHAEFVAGQARCRGCATYAKWDAQEGVGDETRLRVCCRRCGHRWDIHL
jgi:hypothetical protein